MTALISSRNLRRLLIASIAVCAFSTLPLLSSARPSSSINITNNSSRIIRNVYLSHVNVDDWGAEQLEGTSLLPGHSVSVTNSTCDQQQVKVIAEDQDGCFLSAVVSCDSNSSWTITDDTARDCGQ